MTRPVANGTAARRNVRSASVPKNQAVRKAAVPKAHSSGGENASNGVTSAYAIMANRIANRVAEMAESITFVERPRPQQQPLDLGPEEKKKPRKLEMRLGTSGADSVSFSAPFLDNTLQKMLTLQNRMLKSTAELSKTEGVDEKVIREQAAQSAELSRIIALICAEKARQGA
ncbi:hypothetical protein K461DRAFT_226138 [Myriangium duriaei CBS 260.36]|uniref:Uncharacterized protein n=1 Tax=Myriangium duriaei CBS 260.36 TaxID=1168546 RepID=A0A9P4J596_9PEZI|nr:hypothetical protein K461DRAFT_226138 [Myriangium duriaei CBS 260.36]